MTDRIERYGMQVDAALAGFVEEDILAPLGRDAEGFWSGFGKICTDFAPRNRALLAFRD